MWVWKEGIVFVENCPLLGYYAASSGNSLPTCWDNLSAPFSRVSAWLLMGPICCPETSVRNYHYTLRNSPEERGSHLLRGGSLKSRITTLYIITSTAPLERSVKQEGIEGSHVAYVCRKALVAHLLLCNFCVKCTASRLLTFKKACSLTLRKESPCTQQSSVNTRKDPVPTQNNFLVCRVDIL